MNKDECGKVYAKPNRVALVGVCPFCHESAEFLLSKKQVKTLLKGFKRSA